MTLQKIPAFKTDDGFISENEHEALLHQFVIEKTALIEAFMEDVGADYTPRGRATAARILSDLIDMAAMNNLTIPVYPGSVADADDTV